MQTYTQSLQRSDKNIMNLKFCPTIKINIWSKNKTVPGLLRLLCTFSGDIIQGSTSLSEHKIQGKTMLAHTKMNTKKSQKKLKSIKSNLE